jgi:hypothetical protein
MSRADEGDQQAGAVTARSHGGDREGKLRRRGEERHAVDVARHKAGGAQPDSAHRTDHSEDAEDVRGDQEEGVDPRQHCDPGEHGHGDAGEHGQRGLPQAGEPAREGSLGGMREGGDDQEHGEDHQAPVPDVGDGALRGGLPGGIEKAEVEDVEGSAGGRRLETDGRS